VGIDDNAVVLFGAFDGDEAAVDFLCYTFGRAG
jgi:hypothetical protein